jgi:hypothetical protein
VVAACVLQEYNTSILGTNEIELFSFLLWFVFSRVYWCIDRLRVLEAKLFDQQVLSQSSAIFWWNQWVYWTLLCGKIKICIRWPLIFAACRAPIELRSERAFCSIGSLFLIILHNFKANRFYYSIWRAIVLLKRWNDGIHREVRWALVLLFPTLFLFQMHSSRDWVKWYCLMLTVMSNAKQRASCQTRRKLPFSALWKRSRVSWPRNIHRKACSTI